MKLKPEEKLQIEIAQTFNHLKDLGKIDKKVLLYSNRNENAKGGLNGAIAGGIYKKMGRVAGVPDLTLIWRDKSEKLNLVYIEVKTPEAYFTKNGNISKSMGLSKDQQRFIAKYLVPLNIPHIIIYSLDIFLDFLAELKIFKK